jgi:hypothetical protein
MLLSTRNGVLAMMSQAPGWPAGHSEQLHRRSLFPPYGREGNQWSILEGVYTAAPSGRPAPPITGITRRSTKRRWADGHGR